MSDKAVHRRIFLLTVLLVATAPVVLASAFAAIVYAPAFDDFRRNLAIRVLSDLLELPIAIDGDVDLVVANPLKLRISNVSIGGAPGSDGSRARPMNLVELSFPVWPALTGNISVSELIISGGRLELIGETDGGMSAPALARLPSGFLNASVSDHLEFRDIAIHYKDSSGWEFEWLIENFTSRKSIGGAQIELESHGDLNGLKYSLSGGFTNPRGDAGANVPGPFNLILEFAGLRGHIEGTLDISNSVATLDAQLGLAANSLAALLELLRLNDAIAGNGRLDANLSGPLDSIRAERIVLELSDAQGRKLELTGSISNLGGGEGIDVSISADLTGDDLGSGKQAPIAEIDVTGFEGKITGSLDRLVATQIFLFTNVAAAELKHIGPIGLERVVRDSEGRLGFLGIRILEGPEDDPVFDLSGEITDVLDFSGIRLAGDFNISLDGILVPEHGPKARGLGRLNGKLALSDAEGPLLLETFQARLRDTTLISLDVRKSVNRPAAADTLTFDIELHIPDFSVVAARLGGKAKTGAVGFTGVLAFPEHRISLRGAAKIGRTDITVKGDLGFRDGAPFISVDLVSDLLYMSDIERGVQVYEIAAATDSGAIVIELEEKVIRRTRAELDLRVLELDAGGKKVGNIHAQGHYLNGIAELKPFRMSYLNGTVDAHLRADTNQSPPSVAIVGEIDKLDMGRLLTSLDIKPLVTGALDSTFDLSIRVEDQVAISRSLTGTLDAAIQGGTLASRTIDLGGQNVVRWIFSGSGEAKLICAVVALDFSNGRGEFKSIVIETDNVQVVGAGDIDLAADSIALSFSTRPKRRELIDVAVPFTVGGKLTEPVVKLAPGVQAGRVAQEALTLPLNLFGLLLPLGRSPKKQRPCTVEEGP